MAVSVERNIVDALMGRIAQPEIVRQTREIPFQFVQQAYSDIVNTLGNALARTIQNEIAAGKNPVDIAAQKDLEIVFESGEVQKLLTSVTILQTQTALLTSLPPDILTELTTIAQRMQSEHVVVARAQQQEAEAQAAQERLKNPELRNDFEKLLFDNGVPPEVFFLPSAEKYKAFRGYFFALAVDQIWPDVKNSGLTLSSPEMSGQVVAVPGIQQSKSLDAVRRTAAVSVSAEDRKYADELAKQLGDDLATFDIYAKMTHSLIGGEKDKSHDGILEVYTRGAAASDSASNQTLFGQWIWNIFRDFDFPLYEKIDGVMRVGKDAEPVKEKLFRALKELMLRRLFPQDRNDEGISDMYRRMYMTVVPDAREPQAADLAPDATRDDVAYLADEKNRTSTRIKLDYRVITAYRYNPQGLRRQGRNLKLKRIPDGKKFGGDAAMFPRARSVKDAPDQQEAVRRSILYKLAGNNAQGENEILKPGDAPWKKGESALEYVRKTSQGDAEFVNNRAANFALLWAEQMLETSLEAAFQDSRAESKYARGNPQASTRLDQYLNPSLAAIRYLADGTKEGKINEFVIGWQSFLLPFFDYFIIAKRDAQGKPIRWGTIAQHIMWAESFDDVPWEEIPRDASQDWLSHFPQMMGVAAVCFDGYKSSFQNLAELDFKTQQLRKTNPKAADEYIGVYRQIDTYMLKTYCSPSSAVKSAKNRVSEEQIAGAVDSGQFIQIVVQRKGSNERKVEFTRATQFLMIDHQDIATWVPNGKRVVERSGWYNDSGIPGTTKSVRTLFIEVKGNEPLPDPKTLLTREAVARAFASGQNQGNVMQDLKLDDIVMLGIVMSEEIRHLFRDRYFTTVLGQKWNALLRNLSEWYAGDDRYAEFFESEIPNIGGPDLYTKELFFQMLDRVGHKTTLEEFLHAGQTLVGAFTGSGGSSDKKGH